MHQEIENLRNEQHSHPNIISFTLLFIDTLTIRSPQILVDRLLHKFAQRVLERSNWVTRHRGPDIGIYRVVVEVNIPFTCDGRAHAQALAQFKSWGRSRLIALFFQGFEFLDDQSLSEVYARPLVPSMLGYKY